MTSPICSRSRTRWRRRGSTRRRSTPGAHARVSARNVSNGDRDHGERPGQGRPEGPDVQGPRLSRRASGRPTSRWRSRCSAERAGTVPRRAKRNLACRPRALGPRCAAPRMRLAAAQEHLPPQPRRPRRAAVLTADGRAEQPPRRRAAVVHDHVRTRQHLHQPAGASVHARAGGDDAARARLAPGDADRRFPRRGSRAGSCTRCATAS